MSSIVGYLSSTCGKHDLVGLNSTYSEAVEFVQARRGKQVRHNRRGCGRRGGGGGKVQYDCLVMCGEYSWQSCNWTGAFIKASLGKQVNLKIACDTKVACLNLCRGFEGGGVWGALC